MIFGSCHFLCHQFTQRDELDQIIADKDVLAAFSAAFIRSPDIDCLYQLMGKELTRSFRVFSDPLNELFNILVLLFLCFDFLP